MSDSDQPTITDQRLLDLFQLKGNPRTPYFCKTLGETSDKVDKHVYERCHEHGEACALYRDASGIPLWEYLITLTPPADADDQAKKEARFSMYKAINSVMDKYRGTATRGPSPLCCQLLVEALAGTSQVGFKRKEKVNAPVVNAASPVAKRAKKSVVAK